MFLIATFTSAYLILGFVVYLWLYLDEPEPENVSFGYHAIRASMVSVLWLPCGVYSFWRYGRKI